MPRALIKEYIWRAIPYSFGRSVSSNKRIPRASKEMTTSIKLTMRLFTKNESFIPLPILAEIIKIGYLAGNVSYPLDYFYIQAFLPILDIRSAIEFDRMSIFQRQLTGIL